MSAFPTQPMANAIRVLAMDAVQAANSGHPGMPMGCAEAATVLFTRHLKFDPAQPNWADRTDLYCLAWLYADLCAVVPDRISGHDDRCD